VAANLIQIDQITKVYKLGEVDVHALRGISVEIERGSFVAIMGPSGSGKTTFMNIIGCLDKPTSGSYVLDGVDVSTLDRDVLAEIRNLKIGFVFQQFNLLPRTTALENVELPLLYRHDHGRAHRHAKAMRALEWVGLAGRESHHPNQLSGGQQQRVAIARALINDPQIVLADEPTGALDSHTSVEIMALFQKLNHEAGISVILVTHECDIAQYSNRIIHFKDGHLVSDESVPEPRNAQHELETLPNEENAEAEALAP
jgi:putative ABC transport system ATP-binding protein